MESNASTANELAYEVKDEKISFNESINSDNSSDLQNKIETKELEVSVEETSINDNNIDDVDNVPSDKNTTSFNVANKFDNFSIGNTNNHFNSYNYNNDTNNIF